MQEFKTQWKWGAAIVATGVLILGVALLALWPLVFPKRQLLPVPFSQEEWRSSRYSDDGSYTYIRERMLQDLLATHDFQNWDFDRVVALLGTPDTDSALGDQREIRYDLGNGLDYLVFRFDLAGTVLTYYVFNH